MRLADFDYPLPDELIARYPLEKRSDSRLLVVDRATETLSHRHFYDLIDYLNPGDLLVFNNSRVIPARLFGVKPSGGKVEVLIERIVSPTEVLAHVKGSHIKVGSIIQVRRPVIREAKPQDPGLILDSRLRGNDKVGDEHCFRVIEHGQLYRLELTSPLSILALLEQYGHIPLPPYMTRPDEDSDRERYQTVYSKEEGSVAAPTAGLHFDPPLLAALAEKGIEFASVTLHVGAGTFQPVKVENILEHHMHSELIHLPAETVEAIKKTKARGGRVIAVGTTSARTLESVAKLGPLHAYWGETNLFIYPGYQYKVVDALITNFHQPKSSLLMLVSAFMGQALMHQAYQLAMREQYRFLSYGDVMLIS